MRTAPPVTELLEPNHVALMRRRSNWWGGYLVAHAWMTILLTMVLFVWMPNPATFLLAVMIIGSRQLGLLILMHDGAHGVLCSNRAFNNFLSQWLCASPTIADTFIYRRYHLNHHARTLQPNDPDIVLTGHYPITRASLRRKLLRDLTGRTGFNQRRTQFISAMGPADVPMASRLRRFNQQLGRQLVANCTLFLGCIVVGHWYVYPLLWVIPLLTWQQLVLRVRNIAEHAVVGDCNDPFKNARTTVANPLERLLVAPYFVNYHLEHHLMMWVPCYRLPLLRQLLMNNGFGEGMLSARGYLQVLGQVTVDRVDEVGMSQAERAVGTFSDGFDN